MRSINPEKPITRNWRTGPIIPSPCPSVSCWAQWEEAVFNEGVIHRERYLGRLLKYLDNKQIISLTGLRRVGKTTLMKLITAKRQKSQFNRSFNNTGNKVLIESKFYSQLNEKQDKLFSGYPAVKKIVIDSVDKLILLNEL